jgi:hypothetical protein
MVRKNKRKTKSDVVTEGKTVDLKDVNKELGMEDDAMTKATKDEEMEKKDDDTSKPKSSDPKTEIKEEKSTATTLVEAPTIDGGFSDDLDKKISAVEAPNISIAEESNIPASSDLSNEVVHDKVRWVSDYPTSFKVDVTKRDYTFWATPTESIGDFGTVLEFLVRKAELADKLIDKYDGLRMNIPKLIEPSSQGGKINDPSKIGFDITQFNKVESSMPVRMVRDTLRGMFIEKIDEVFESAYYVGSDWENELIDLSNQLWRRDLYEVRDIHSVYRTLLSTTEYRVKPLDEEIARLSDQHLIYWPDYRYDVMNWFLDNNQVLQKSWVQLASTEVLKSLEVKASSESIKISELSNTLQLSSNVTTGLRDITTVVSADSAFQTLHLIFMSILFRKYFAMDFQVEFDSFSWTTLIEIILAHIIIPKECFAARTIIKMNNYILRHFIAKLASAFQPGTSVLKYTLATKIDFETKDYLVDQKDDIPVALWNFFGNWGDGPENAQMPYTFSSQAFKFSDGTFSSMSQTSIMGRTLAFHPWGGKIREDWAEETPQFDNYRNFVYYLSKDKFATGMIEGNDQRLRRFFSFFVDRTDTISQLMFYANEAMKRMSISPLAAPDNRNPLMDDGLYKITVPTGGVMSLLTILMPTTFQVKPPSLEMIEAGRGTSKTFLRMVETYHLSTDIYPKKSHFKSDIIEKTIAHMPDSGLKGMLKTHLEKVLLGAPEKHHIKFPPRNMIDGPTASKYYLMTTKARQIVDDNPADFGYAKSFYYTPNSRRQNGSSIIPKLHEIYAADEFEITDVHSTYDFTSLLDALTDELYSEDREDAKDRNKIIEFKFPIKIKLTDGAPSNNSNVPPWVFTMNDTSNLLLDNFRVGAIEIFYQWKEDHRSKRHNSQSSADPPSYRSPEIPALFDCLDTFLSYPRIKDTYRSGAVDHTLDELITFFRRSDV